MLIDTNHSVLVVGDLILDHYIWGSCERISPEAPVQIIDVTNESFLLGGCGNVVNNLKSIGANVSLISVMGDCPTSNKIQQILSDIDVDSKYIFQQPNRFTSKKTRVISSNHHVIRFDKESKDDIDENLQLEIINLFSEILNNFDIVILSDYGKGVITDYIARQIISISNKNNTKVIVDPKGSDYSKYKSAYLLTPNKKEASLATGIEIIDQSSLEISLKKLKSEFNLKISLITLSEEGIGIYDNEVHVYPTTAREVFDVTGAGDTVISLLAICIASGLDIQESVQLANIAAGIVVGKVGSATASLDEIYNYHQNLNSELNSYIEDWGQLSEKINTLKGKKIVFTNGCFDILHYGHVKYLEEAKKLGDFLVVGINSDKSISNLKGKSRPINTLSDRANIINSLKSVDIVIPFEEDTPLELIKYISPDVLVKGSDYKDKKIVGAEFAKEVVLIDYIKGRSSTNIIKKILNNEKNN